MGGLGTANVRHIVGMSAIGKLTMVYAGWKGVSR